MKKDESITIRRVYIPTMMQYLTKLLEDDIKYVDIIGEYYSENRDRLLFCGREGDEEISPLSFEELDINEII
jgi:hypothetical protein